MKRLALNAMANVAQMLLGTVLLFALYRYINNALGVAQLGVWSVVIATVSASRLADLGLTAGVTRFVARDKGNGDSERSTDVIDTATITLAIVVGLLMPAFHYLLGKVLPHFFQNEDLRNAHSVLPIALISLWLTILASVIQGGLEGCQRMELRAGLVLCGQCLLLMLSIWLVPNHGLQGLAWAQVGQGLFLVCCGRLLLRRVMPRMTLVPRRWKRKVLREMLGYGANLQASTVFILLFDPVAKALMARFGGAAAVGYFEMASQVVLRVRSVIVTANQAVVPHVASWTSSASDMVQRFFHDNTRALIFVTLPAITLLLAAGPVVSQLLIGAYQFDFVVILCVLAVAWGINVMAGPAYFTNMGTGHVGENTLSHAVTGVSSAVISLLLGPLIGATGVLVGYVVGIVVGTAFLIIAFRRRHSIPFRFRGGREHLRLLIVFLFAVVWVGATFFNPSLRHAGIAVLALVVTALSVFLVAWSHALRKELLPKPFGLRWLK